MPYLLVKRLLLIIRNRNLWLILKKILVTSRDNGLTPFPAKPLIIIEFVKKDSHKMEGIKTIAFRGGNDLIANLQLCIDRISYTIPDVMNRISGQYNVRCVFEKVENQLTFSDSILGELINQTYLGKSI